jgi:hypothetical protein
MQTISNDHLDTVTGGTGSTIPGGSSSAAATPSLTPSLGTGTGSGCGLLNGLSSISSSLANLNKNNNGFSDTDMMMFGMAMMMSRPAASPVYVESGYGGGGCHGSFSFHGRW